MVVLGHNHLIIGSVVSGGCRHPEVALGDMSVCVIFLCKESSAVSRVSGPLKAGFPLLRHT
jgi:hypothetical protein